jgi:hypothetical protein
MSLIPLLSGSYLHHGVKKLETPKSAVSNSCALHWLRLDSRCSARHNTPPLAACFPFVVWSDRHGFRGNEVGSLQTTPVQFGVLYDGEVCTENCPLLLLVGKDLFSFLALRILFFIYVDSGCGLVWWATSRRAYRTLPDRDKAGFS